MGNIFKKTDIKAGYLLRVKNTDDGHEFNMTVVPAAEYAPDEIAVLFLGVKPRKAGDLAVCNPGKDWWPMNAVDDNLDTEGHTVVAVYGYTDPKFLMDNSTEKRELLWRREIDEEPAEEEKPEPVKMTMAEIEEKLGHPVEVVEF